MSKEFVISWPRPEHEQDLFSYARELENSQKEKYRKF